MLHHNSHKLQKRTARLQLYKQCGQAPSVEQQLQDSVLASSAHVSTVLNPCKLIRGWLSTPNITGMGFQRRQISCMRSPAMLRQRSHFCH